MRVDEHRQGLRPQVIFGARRAAYQQPADTLGVAGGGGGHAPPLFPRAHKQKPDAHAASEDADCAPRTSANTSPPLARARARANGGAAGNQRPPWPADKVERWRIERLIPYAKNARTHSDAQIAAIAASIKDDSGARLRAGLHGALQTSGEGLWRFSAFAPGTALLAPNLPFATPVGMARLDRLC